MIPQSQNRDRAEKLLVVMIGFLSKPIRDSFDQLLEKKFFDYQIHKMMRLGKFPEWFRNMIHWDPLFGRCCGLRCLLQLAARDRLLEISDLRYRIVISGDEARELAGETGVEQKDLRAWIRELDERLRKVPPDIVRLPGQAGKDQHIPGEEGDSENNVVYEIL